MATGWPMKTTYANGDVYSASDVNDITGTINLLGSSVAYSAGKNIVPNSAMQIWQRGTTSATTAFAFTADRWQKNAYTHYTVSRQTTSDTTNLPFIQYCARVQRTASSAVTDLVGLVQNLETVTSIPMAGRTVTFSFYARKGANYSAASSGLNVNLYSGTGTDQNLYTSYTGTSTIVSQTATLTTTWQRFTYTGTVPATATELSIYFNYTPVGTAGAADFYEISGVQIEQGSTATAFQTATGTIQGELAACQRYYWRLTPVQNETEYGVAIATGTGGAQVMVNNPVPMRVQATSVDYSTLSLLLPGVAFYAASGITIASNASSTNVTSVTLSASGLTTSRVYFLTNNGTNVGYLGFSAEL
jgi:hypothetical protein